MKNFNSRYHKILKHLLKTGLFFVLFCAYSNYLWAGNVDKVTIEEKGYDEYGYYIQFLIPVSDISNYDAWVTTGKLIVKTSKSDPGTVFIYFTENDRNKFKANFRIAFGGARAKGRTETYYHQFWDASTDNHVLQDGTTGDYTKIRARWYVPASWGGKSLYFSVRSYIDKSGTDIGEKDYDITNVSVPTFLPAPTISAATSDTRGKISISYSYNTTIGVSDYKIKHWLSHLSNDVITDNTNKNPKGSIEVKMNNYPLIVTLHTNLIGKDERRKYKDEQRTTIPAYVWPDYLTAEYNDSNKVKLSWTVNKVSGKEGTDYIGGDRFEVARSTDSTFSDENKIISLSKKLYDPTQTRYSVTDDLSNLEGSSHIFYRLRRTASKDKWKWDEYRGTDKEIQMNTTQKADTAKLIETPDGPQAKITWKPFRGVWISGTKFSIHKINKTTGALQQTIDLKEDEARSGKYIDKYISYCNEYVYTIEVTLGKGYPSPGEIPVPGDILAVKIGTIKDLTVSKGYFPDRVELHWRSEGVFDNYIVKRKVYGSSDDYEQIASIPGSSTSDLQTDDSKGTPGVYYQYMVVGAVKCNNEIKYSKDILYAVGFRAPTGNIYGRITYENGQAVEGTTVRLESHSNQKLGQSIYLNGEGNSYLKIDSLQKPFTDSAFTIGVWIKPDTLPNSPPQNQVIFSRENQYELGFDANGKLYFSYKNDSVSGFYKNKNTSFVHITAIHSHDSLKIMLGDLVLARKAISYSPADNVGNEVFIGRNAGGHHFKGYIDEMLVWNIALSDSVIASDYTRLLTGGEHGLAAYWRFDETIEDQFYDLSHNGDQYNMNDGTMDPKYVKHTDTIPTFDQLALKAYTDSTGNYMVSGIPYTGVNGTTYRIVPRLGTHQYDPVSVNRLVSASSASFTVDFKDKSSFPVSGIVYYRNSTIPVKGVQFSIDGNFAQKGNGEIIETNAQGQFAISVPVGTHEVKAVKAHHVFVNGGKITDRHGNNLNYQERVAERILYDSTTVRFIGRVAGGAIQGGYPLGHSLSSNNLGKVLLITMTLPNIGKYKINASSHSPDSIVTVNHLLPSFQTDSSKRHKTKIEFKQDTIYIHADNVTGEFAVDLIPEKFNILHVNATGWDDILDGKAVALDLTAEFIPKYSVYADSAHKNVASGNDTTYIDSVGFNYAYSFIKRVSPSVSIKQTANNSELTFFGDTVYVYHAKDGSTTRIPVVDTTKTGKAQYLFGYPVFTKGKDYQFKIKAFEEYHFYESVKQDGTPVEKEQDGKPLIDKVPTSDGEVSLYNNIQNGTTQAVVLHLDSATGTVKYNFTAGDPELAKPGTKDFAASIRFGQATDKSWEWFRDKKLHVYIMGGKSSGQDFVTAGPNKILMILRDPPGNRSYSFVEKGATISTNSTYTGSIDQIGDEQTNNEVTVDAITWQGVGAGTITEIKSGGGVDIGVHHEEHFTGSNTTNNTTTITTRFQTSDDPAFVGARGDVYVGHSTNTTYGPSNNLIIIKRGNLKKTDSVIYNSTSSPYIIVKREGLVFGQQFGTLFAYPQQHIVKILLPNLLNLRNSFLLPMNTSPAKAQQIADNTKTQVYVSKLDADDPDFGKSNIIDHGIFDGNGASYKIYFPTGAKYYTDTIKTLNQYMTGWKLTIAKNEEEKINSKLFQNYSFHAGNPVDYSKLITNYSRDTTYSFNIILAGSVMSTSFAQLPGVGFEFKYQESLGTQQGGTFHQSTDSVTTMGFRLAADGTDEYLSVDVNKAEDNGFVFLTKGGESGCPYEGATKTLYYQKGTQIDQPSLQIEVPKLKVDNPVANNVPATQVASYTLYLTNESEAKLPATFVLNYANTDSVKGAFIAVDGSSIASGRSFAVQFGQTVKKVLTLTKGPGAMDYNNIPIILHSACQYDPTGYLDLIADTVLISAHFVPSCSNINIKAPLAQWILNTGSPTNSQGIRYLPVTLNDFDLSNKLFDRVELQYKPHSSSTWITAMKFYDDSAKLKVAQGGKQFITNAQGINYNLEMDEASFNDQKYDIRALAVCNLGPGNEITTPSDIVSGLKDTYSPRLFGSPQPADGILGIEDNIRLDFNEPIAAGLLTHANFKVTGIRNGAKGDHSVSVSLDGQGDYLTTEFDKNLTGKDITVEMWVLPDNKEDQTIFSQGNINESMEMAFTAGNHLQVIIGNKKIESDKSLDYKPGEWAHVALVYNQLKQTVSAFYNYIEVIHDVSVGHYSGIGPFEIGRSIRQKGNLFAGKMHEMRVWSQVRSALMLQINSLTRLSGAENGLLAYYPMNEGKGEVAFDKAHGNHAKLVGNWITPAGKSIELGGNSYVKMSTAISPITSDMDYTIELWFKGVPGQADAALVSNGKGDGTDPGGSKDLFFLGFEDSLLTYENNGFKIQTDGNYLDEKWHQVTISVNRTSGVAQFYVDGVLQKFFDAKNLGGIASAYTYLGAREWYDKDNANTPHFDRYFNGVIDEFRLWNTYLNQTLISNNDNVRLKGDELGLMVYYPYEKYYEFQNNKEMDSTLMDQKVQDDPNVKVPYAVAVNAKISDDMAPIKDRGPVDNLQFNFVVNNDALIINMQEPKQAIAKTIVTLQAEDVRDENGNVIVSPITWTAYIDQNQLKWSDDELNLSKDLYDPMKFESYVVNNGGNVQHFRLDNLPAWLAATPSSGTVDPKEKQKITFTVNKGLNVGTYNEIVYMLNDNDVSEALPFNLKVKGEVPDWKVNPADFKYSMTVYGKLRINQIFSDDDEDIIAAFVDGKCVGITNNTYFTNNDLWYTFLTVYSNTLNPGQIEFRIWDASTGKIYQGIPSMPVAFKNDAIIGTSRNPVIFDTKEMLFQDIDLNKGWSWISFNLTNPNLKSVNTTLSNGSWQPGDEVKNEELGFDQYSSMVGWAGTLEGFNNASLFMLKTANAQILSTNGSLVDVKKAPITIRGKRWNYISYLPSVNMTVKEALAGYEASEEDVIKSQTGFAMYDSRNGWVGNLTYLEPGKGYMLYRVADSDTKLVYPSLSGSLTIHRIAGRVDNGIARLNDLQSPVGNNFKFADNMTIVAVVGKEFALQPNDTLLAFAGGDLRGKAQVIKNPVTNSGTLFFNIAGQQAQPVYFEVKRGNKTIAQTDPVIMYNSNTMLGSVSMPFVIHFSKLLQGVRVFPNPFSNQVNVEVEMTGRPTQEPHEVEVAIYDVAGRLILKLPRKFINNGHYQATWDGRDANGLKCNSGVYFVNISIDGVKHVYKVMKINKVKP